MTWRTLRLHAGRAKVRDVLSRHLIKSLSRAALVPVVMVASLVMAAPAVSASAMASHTVPGTQDGISCLSTRTCVIVGYNAHGVGDVVVVRNGATVAQTPVPGSKSFYSVSCAQGAGCVAVGQNADDSELMLVTTDGSGSVVSTKSIALAPGVTLTRISCVTTSSCALSGDNIFATPVGLDIGHWDGASITVHQVPAPKGTTAPTLEAVSCSGATCVAVGSAIKGTGVDGLVLRSTAWGVPRLQVVPGYSIYGAACPSPTLCYGSGFTRTGGFVMPLNPTGPGPVARVSPDLLSIACHGTTCVSAGETLAPPGAPAKDVYYGALVTTAAGRVTSTALVADSDGYFAISQYGGAFVALGTSRGQLAGFGSEVTTGQV
jgi:hypothetical protein